MDNPDISIHQFEDFRLDINRRLLCKGETLVALPPKAFDILQLLVERRGELVEKDEIMRTVWAGLVVEDNNLTVNMSLIRRALGEKRGENRFIVTVPGRGYRFTDLPPSKGSEPLRFEKAKPDDQNSDGRFPGPAPVSTGRRPSTLRIGILIIAVAAGLSIAAWLVFFRSTAAKIETPGQIRTLAVLPFRPLAASEQDAILGVGMADALISKLSGLRRITVRPTSAIAKYAAGNADLLAAGRELNVDAVLDGKIQRSGDALRISVQLIRVFDNSPVWAGTFDTKETDIFALQDSISAQVAESLTFRLNDDERRRIAQHPTNNSDAYKLYLNGQYQLSKRNIASALLAVNYFEQAIQKQPDYALAYAGLGDAYMILGNQEALLGALSPSEYIPKSKAALKKALSLDDSLAEANATMAWVSIWETGDIVVPQQNIRRALELNPDLANAHHYNGLLLMVRGRFDEALAEMRKAQAIDQFSLIYNLNIATVLFRAKRYAEAEGQCRKTLELDQNFARAHWLLGLIFEAEGKYPEAITALYRSVELSGDGVLAEASLAHALAKSGNRVEAQRILDKLLRIDGPTYITPDYLAMLFAALGDRDQAFKYLEKALIDRPFSMFQLAIEQRFDDIRTDPRFAAIEARIKEYREAKSNDPNPAP